MEDLEEGEPVVTAMVEYPKGLDEDSVSYILAAAAESMAKGAGVTDE